MSACRRCGEPLGRADWLRGLIILCDVCAFLAIWAAAVEDQL